MALPVQPSEQGLASAGVLPSSHLSGPQSGRLMAAAPEVCFEEAALDLVQLSAARSQ